jgi:hypothetical protein
MENGVQANTVHRFDQRATIPTSSVNRRSMAKILHREEEVAVRLGSKEGRMFHQPDRSESRQRMDPEMFVMTASVEKDTAEVEVLP